MDDSAASLTRTTAFLFHPNHLEGKLKDIPYQIKRNVHSQSQ
jgi:hypothetical protein